MSKSLIIVESPAKTKTLKRFLGRDFQVLASMGHVRDLPKSKLGVDIENDFTPSYTNIRERLQTLKELKKAVEGAKQVYLASDPDREGEAIAWHLSQALKLEHPLRIEFNEITESAVRSALARPRQIDLPRVNAQQARRVLDRLVGYKLSPLLWKKVQRNLSAGRVQSVAVRLICEREREIQAFAPVEYWSLTARLTPQTSVSPFEARLIERRGEKIELHNQAEAEAVIHALKEASYAVRKIRQRQQKRNAAPPFITSTLQQEAARKLGFSARRTMSLAQQLYEGVELGADGHIGLITYMRTDSVRVASEAQAEAREFIQETYGESYVPAQPRQFRSRGKVQDAHEAIRPTSIRRRPESVEAFLDRDQLRLYRLIWQRFVASQMEPAVYDIVTVDIAALDYLFRAVGSTLKFPGFTIVYTEGRDEQQPESDEDNPALPRLSEGESLDLLALTPRQHFTEPPPRYTEPTLVKALEEKGIGRPSTYATILSTILERGYVEMADKKFHPTELGFVVTDMLVKHFPNIMDVQFTAGVEDHLDDIEEGSLDWIQLLRDFYAPFEETLNRAQNEIEAVKVAPKETDIPCPNCGKNMVIRRSRFGEFLGCSGYPECKTILKHEKDAGIPCPKEGCSGRIMERKSKKKRTFYGCTRYPECDFVSWDKPLDRACPDCGAYLVEKKGRSPAIACSSPACAYRESVQTPENQMSGVGS
ncbi:MAG: type I DNA topoisomerase [Armatimonadetes bacterium]|nr:type I DNA topoisomerase [Armatimonadota bacterium]